MFSGAAGLKLTVPQAPLLLQLEMDTPASPRGAAAMQFPVRHPMLEEPSRRGRLSNGGRRRDGDNVRGHQLADCSVLPHRRASGSAGIAIGQDADSPRSFCNDQMMNALRAHQIPGLVCRRVRRNRLYGCVITSSTRMTVSPRQAGRFMSSQRRS